MLTQGRKSTLLLWPTSDPPPVLFCVTVTPTMMIPSHKGEENLSFREEFLKHRSSPTVTTATRQQRAEIRIDDTVCGSVESSPSRKRPSMMRNLSSKIWLGVGILLIAIGHRFTQTEASEHREAVVTVQDAIVETLLEGTNKDEAAASSFAPKVPLYGNLTSALYRFEASRLGPKYAKAIERFDEWIGQQVDSEGAKFAKLRTMEPGPRQHHQECFHLPNEDKLLDLEGKKKTHPRLETEQRLQFLREEQEIFFGPSPTANDTMITKDNKWAWRSAASFSAQFGHRQSEFRHSVMEHLHDPEHSGYFGGVISGTFWYPPNAIREWHTNAWDLHRSETTGKISKPWRMYYVRQKAAALDGTVDTSRSLQEHPEYFQDKSGMHLVDGPGLPPSRLKEVGAYRLPPNDDPQQQQQQQGGPSVWRVPDKDGYVSLFRLQIDRPFRWHCIVTDDTVHRYSMGMSLSDEGVERMLAHAGVDL